MLSCRIQSELVEGVSDLFKDTFQECLLTDTLGAASSNKFFLGLESAKV